MLRSTATGDDREWIGVEGTGLGGTFSVPGIDPVAISAATLAINRASGSTGGVSATPLDWTQTGLTAAGLTLTDARNSLSGTVAAITLADGLLSGAATFALAAATVDAPGLDDARLTTLELTAFTFSVANGFLTLASGADGSLKLASLRPAAPDGRDARHPPLVRGPGHRAHGLRRHLLLRRRRPSR